ncbi:DUF2927 domain-containing protein [Thetidibacter halocola]|uniref:DUF2927 domain-containing protein n=1 Tax=Thetidibacter halocola TaxID=2827239 RepID=A0A8J7WDH2_9RHOB|nr:DUF2927 domain-containing protein [Thetidibacter halocola]MBS0125590.1 DUF2927 domain-containing protein [Thetidibacter halocola]
MVRALALLLIALAGLTACETSPLAPRRTAVTPAERPANLAPIPAPTPGPSVAEAESRALSAYYRRVQSDLLVRGLLRTDGGGPDTQFTDTMLARNFAKIALAEEYERGAGLTPSRGGSSAIKKWLKPIRISAEFGASVGQDQRVIDRNELGVYARKLSRISGHPITLTDQNPNFHVLFYGAPEYDQVAPRIRQIVPDVNPKALDVFDNLPREIHCLVIAFSETPGGYEYGTAIALIRAEHPELLRRSCIHEEIAQGMGLGNDDPRARPSIFNDDDEFALLTRHDEMLLEILYDPRLRPGMSASEAMPIVREKAAALVGGGS